jgi:hypothetical protein
MERGSLHQVCTYDQLKKVQTKLLENGPRLATSVSSVPKAEYMSKDSTQLNSTQLNWSF